MISHIFIKDFAIIENIDVDLYPGLNVITGETGAGKSIIIEAVSMALGSRADLSMIRGGAEKALIQLVVDETGLPETECTGIELLTREILASGKSICRIDGEIVTLARFAAATQKIADIHGQYDHQSLLDESSHIGIVDAYRADYIQPAKARVADCWASYREIRDKYESLLDSESSSKRELEFLRYEVNEINAAKPVSGEYETIAENVKIMQNGEKVHDCLTRAYEQLQAASPSAVENLGNARGMLMDIAGFSDEYRDFETRISEHYYGIEELSYDISKSLDRLEYSEQALNESISRLDLLDRLLSKYGGRHGNIDDVLAYRDSAEARLSNIENIDAVKTDLAAELEKAERVLAEESKVLSGFRRKAAEELEKSVETQLRELNFSDARFRVEITETDYAANGMDKLEFLLSANKGQPFLPVSRTASGGEMSRLMLAMKSAAGDTIGIPTMIFDEIDTGISGVTASVVGEKLIEMASDRQIICITHLPQIAACAAHHFVIAKSSDDKTTYTTIIELTGEERVSEIARLLGGKKITESALSNARDLIKLSRN